MTALTGARNTVSREGNNRVFPAKANAVGFQGGIAVLDSTGHLIAGATATGLTAVGMLTDDYDATGLADGVLKPEVRQGEFLFDNEGTDLVVVADTGKDCYIVDDQTVAKTDGTATRSICGKITEVTAQAVWVLIGMNP